MKDFAVMEGYEPNTVERVVSRYAGSNRNPRGALARAIYQKIERKAFRFHHGGIRQFQKPSGTLRRARVEQ